MAPADQQQQDCQRQRHADEQQVEWLDVGQGVFRADETGTPQKDKNQGSD